MCLINNKMVKECLEDINMIWVILDIVLAVLCALGGFFPNVTFLFVTAWIAFGVITIWQFVNCIIMSGESGFFVGFVLGVLLWIALPVVGSLLITHFAFHFIDARTFLFGGAAMCVMGIFSQLGHMGD